MDPSLAIIDQALKGDVGALSFLERTASIYVFDGTNPGKPKICGAWDFLSQALTELERFEARIVKTTFPPFSVVPNMEAHAQLLATMSRRASRRSPSADQKLVEICLTNASFRGSAEEARQLIDYNRHMREREMGRIAAIVFDFSNYREAESYHNQQGHVYQSAFVNPIVMESLCAVVAANAVSTGPDELVNLVSNWIIPSIENLPAFAVASITCHIAGEAMAKSTLAGIRDALTNKLLDVVLSNVLGPMLQEAVRESDNTSGLRTKNQRLASMVLKALERWCAVTSCTLIRIKQVCQMTKINIIEVISDTMYSDSEMIMDSLAEFLETLLLKHVQDGSIIEGLTIVGSVANTLIPSSNINSSFSPKNSMDQFISFEMEERQKIALELVAAISLQRFRFIERLAQGDTSVCRSLLGIARSIAAAFQTEIKSDNLQGAEKGLIDLLIRAIRHPSIHVCGIALETLSLILTPRSDLATQLLPMLQGKAIVPPFLVGLTSQYQCDVDYNEFERFREHLLTEVLVSCYTINRTYYIESCTSAIEEFCSTTSTPNAQTAYQLEAAVFCLGAISIEATKRALLILQPPAAQEAAAKAAKLRNHETFDISNIALDAKLHDELLARTTRALSTAPDIALSNPLFLSQMCRFLGKYAKWMSQTPELDILHIAATLALHSFDRAAIQCHNDTENFSEITISPFSDAATALRNILSRSPQRFTSTDALSTLENGWKSIYNLSVTGSCSISIDDKKSLCSGIARVLAVLPVQQWLNSLLSFTHPIIEFIDSMSKSAVSISIKYVDTEHNAMVFERLGEEMSILAMTLRTFITAASKDSNDVNSVESPVFSVLQKVWSSLTLIASVSFHHKISAPLCELLIVAVSLGERFQNIRLLKNVYKISETMMESVSKHNQSKALEPIIELAGEVVNAFGPTADNQTNTVGMENMSEDTCEITEIIKDLIKSSFVIVHSISHDSQLDILPSMFSLCTYGIQKCPILFMSLTNQMVGHANGELFVSSIEVAVSSIEQKHVDASRSAMLYLKEVLISSAHMNKDYIGLCQRIISPFLREIVTKVMHGTCGNFPKETLDPAASLVFLLLQKLDDNEAQQVIETAVCQTCMQLGDPAKNVIISILRQCAHGNKSVSLLMNLFDDVWCLYQREDNGNLAAVDLMKFFLEKWKRFTIIL